MKKYISVSIGLNRSEFNKAAKLYWQAFSGKLNFFLGPKKKGEMYISKIINNKNVFVARDKDNHIVGLSGFRDKNGGVIGGSHDDLVAVYGYFGALWRFQFMKLLAREDSFNFLHLDAVCVEENSRCKGVGKKLISFAKELAKAKSLKGIDLDVISSNGSAITFYRKLNFYKISEAKIGRIGLMGYFLGYKSIIRMRLDL